MGGHAGSFGWGGLFLERQAPLPELVGGHAKAFPESPDEIVGVAKAAPKSYLGHGKTGSFQKLLAVGQAVQQQVLLGAVSNLLFKQVGEIAVVHVKTLCQICNLQVLRKICFNITLNVPSLVACSIFQDGKVVRASPIN